MRDNEHRSGGIVNLTHHPGPDVRRAIAKDNTPSGFVLAQNADGVTICEDQIREIENKRVRGRLCIDKLAQFAQIGCVELPDDREHNPSVPRALNFQHRPQTSVVRTQLPGQLNIPEKYE